MTFPRWLKWRFWSLTWIAACLASGGAFAAEPVPVIDVLAVHTSEVRPDLPDLRPYFEELVAGANRIFVRSGARLQLRLVHVGKVVRSASVRDNSGIPGAAHLKRLVEPGDGIYDEVQSLRDLHHADIVVLLSSDPNYTALDAATQFATDDTAFAVIHDDRYDGPARLARKIGYLLGCGETRATLTWRGLPPVVAAFPFAYSHTLTNRDGVVYTTLMEGSDRSVPYFSNPTLVIDGVVMGIPGQADNARALSERAPTVSAFRAPAESWVLPDIRLSGFADGEVTVAPSNLELSAEVAGVAAVRSVLLAETTSRPRDAYETFKILGTLDRPPFRWSLSGLSEGWHTLEVWATDTRGAVNRASVRVMIRPANDDFARRLPLAGSAAHAPVRLVGSSRERGEPDHPGSGAPGLYSVWFSWTAPASGLVRISGVSSMDGPARVTVYRGDQLGSLSFVAGEGIESVPYADGGNRLQFVAGAGDRLQIQVMWSRSTAPRPEFPFEDLHLRQYPEVPNDDLSSSTPLPADGLVAAASTVGAKPDAVPGMENAPAVWWSWVAPADGWAVIGVTTGAGGAIGLYRGETRATLELLSLVYSSPGSGVQAAGIVRKGDALRIALSSSATESTGLQARLEPFVANDSIAGALPLEGESVESPTDFHVSGDLREALGPYNQWWIWTAPRSGHVFVAAGLPNAIVGVFRGTTAATLVPVAVGQSSQHFEARAGETYLVGNGWPLDAYAFGFPAFTPEPLRLKYREPNDRFETRTVLAGASVRVTVPSLLATSPPNPPYGFYHGQGMLWWEWTAPSDGSAVLRLTSSSDTPPVHVFRDPVTAPPGADLVPGPSFGGTTQFNAHAGERFFFQADGCEPDFARGCFAPRELELRWSDAVVGDAFADRRSLPAKGGVVPTAGIEQATWEIGEPPREPPFQARSLWWTWQASATGTLELSQVPGIDSGDLSGTLEVFRGSSLSTLVHVGSARYSPLALYVSPGDTLQIRKTDGSSSESFVLAFQAGAWNDDASRRRVIVGTNVLEVTTQYFDGHTDVSGSAPYTAWFEWRSPADGTATVDVGPVLPAGILPWVAVFPLSAAGEAAVPPRPERQGYGPVKFTAQSGRAYAISLATTKQYAGTMPLRMLLEPADPVPANDRFASRQPLPTGDAGSVTASLRRATAEPGEPNHAGRPAARSVWWTWTTPVSGRVGFSLRSARDSSYARVDPKETRENGRLAVYEGTDLSALTEVARGSTTDGTGSLAFDWPMQAGVEYVLAVDAVDLLESDRSEFTLEWVVRPPNDELADALPLVGADIEWDGTTVGATPGRADEVLESGLILDRGSVWWAWLAPADAYVEVTFEDGRDLTWALLQQFRPGDPWHLVLQRSSDLPNTVYRVKAGTEYRVLVSSALGRGKPFRARLHAAVADANDRFEDRRLLTGVLAEETRQIDGSGLEPGEPLYPGNAAGSAWWTWEAPVTGRFAVFAGSLGSFSRPERYLGVYQGRDLTDLVTVAQARQELVFEAVAGTTYQIAVSWTALDLAARNRGEPMLLKLAQAPANDRPTEALALTGVSAWFRGDLQGASRETNGIVGRGVWARWTAPRDGRFQVAAPGVFLSVYSGSAPDLLVPESQVVAEPFFDLAYVCIAGRTYWLHCFLDDVVPASQAFECSLTLELAGKNDAFADRAKLVGPRPRLWSEAATATAEPAEPAHRGLKAQSSLWWSWTAPASEEYVLLAPVAAVYVGASLPTLVSVPGWEDDYGQFHFRAQAGQEYHIAVDRTLVARESVDTRHYVDFVLAPPPRPTNDNFAARKAIPESLGYDSADLRGATREPGEPVHGVTTGEASVWWTWRASASGVAHVAISGPAFSPDLTVYAGEALDRLVPLARNAIRGQILEEAVFVAREGDSYQIAVDTSRRRAGNCMVSVRVEATAPNDRFADRSLLFGTDLSVTAFSRGAVGEPAEADWLGVPIGGTVWWEWTAPKSGPVHVSTAGTDFDSVLAVFSGRTPSAATLVAQDDDSASYWLDRPAVVQFDAVAGATYTILVGGYGAAAGTARLSVSQSAQPAVGVAVLEALVSSRGEFHLRLTGPAGYAGTLEWSRDLTEWTGYQRFLLTGEPVDVTFRSPESAGFFRFRP